MTLRTKIRLRNLYGWFSFPALLLHEVMHIGMAWILRKPFDLDSSHRVQDLLGGQSIFLIPKDEKVAPFWKQFFISLAPIIPIVLASVVSLFFSWGSLLLAYFLLTWKYSFPSKQDIFQVRFWRAFTKDYFVTERFLAKKDFFQEESEEEASYRETQMELILSSF